MEEKDQSQQTSPGEGRRLASGKGLGRGGRIAVAVSAVLAAVLLGGYLGLCAYASGDRVMPRTRVADVDLGGLTLAQAEERLQTASADRYRSMEVPIRVGERTVTFSAERAGAVAVGGADRAAQAGKERFLTSGWNYLTALLGRQTQLNWTVRLENSGYVSDVLARVSAAVDQPVEETAWTVEETEDSARLALTRGRTGQTVDQKAVYNALLAALTDEGGEVTAQLSVAPPREPDFDALVREVEREPENAALDPETNEIVPHKLGLRADAKEIEAAYASLAEGESGYVPLEVEAPEITTLDLRISLFRDVLGEGSSRIGGDANRVNNVLLATKACDGVILLPGEKMSYNQTTGQRTTAKGYREAAGYTAKGQEMMVGGGVCQPSSTLYLACLNANLEIVERKNHMYAVGYMPDGMDATVSWPNLDYVFANNTPYPIKVDMKAVNRVLTVRIYGTKTDDTYVKMESRRLSTTPAETVYQADETIPRGTTKVLQSAHTGKKVEVYKCIYDGQNNLLSRTLISTDTYRKTDKVVGYNPLDGVPGVIDPLPAEPSAEPSPAPSESAPAATPSPADGEPPASPEPSQEQPGPSPEPPAAETPEPSPDESQGLLPAVPTPASTPQGIPAE